MITYRITPRYHLISLLISVMHAAQLLTLQFNPMLQLTLTPPMVLPRAPMMMTLPLLDYLLQPLHTQALRLVTSFIHHHPFHHPIISVTHHSGLLFLQFLPLSLWQKRICTRSLFPHFLLLSPPTSPHGGSHMPGMTPTALSSASFLIGPSGSLNGLLTSGVPLSTVMVLRSRATS